jgi:DNA-binding response OmpR family regulator
LQAGDMVLHPARQVVIANGKAHALTPKECQLLATFMQYPGEILTREFLMREVWETDYYGDMRTLDVHVSWLRKKIEPDPSLPQRIQTVRGVGFVFNAD